MAPQLNQAKAIADEKAQTTSYDDVFSGAVFSIAVKKNALLLSKQHDRVSEARLVGSTWQDACFNAKGEEQTRVGGGQASSKEQGVVREEGKVARGSGEGAERCARLD